MEPLLYLNGNEGTGLLAFGQADSFDFSKNKSWYELDQFLQKHKGSYVFGALSYDLKNEFEQLSSSNEGIVDFPLLYFFVPNYVVEINEEVKNYLQGEECEAANRICDSFLESIEGSSHGDEIQLLPSLSKEKYIDKVNALLDHIQQGDIYEITFCQQFTGKGHISSPAAIYGALNAKTKAPFSSYFRLGGNYLLSGSPERFIRKEGSRISSQPIKGTAGRSVNRQEDELLKDGLLKSQKERSENVMIVDLVRNDLSKIAAMNSVVVEELFGIYSFSTVHQMISTVAAELKAGVTFSEILRALFPMGSMTGAPKVRAMKLIEEYEDFRRGLFSGSVGYIKPNGDFDFNVVIRSILYDDVQKRISCPVGSAITIQSSPELEYEECLLKVNAMVSVLNGK